MLNLKESKRGYAQREHIACVNVMHLQLTGIFFEFTLKRSMIGSGVFMIGIRLVFFGAGEKPRRS